MLTENQLEQDCLNWFRDGDWETVFGPDIAHDGSAPERADYWEVVLVGQLSRALARLNPSEPTMRDSDKIVGTSRVPNANGRNPDKNPDKLSGFKQPESRWLRKLPFFESSPLGTKKKATLLEPPHNEAAPQPSLHVQALTGIEKFN